MNTHTRPHKSIFISSCYPMLSRSTNGYTASLIKQPIRQHLVARYAVLPAQPRATPQLRQSSAYHTCTDLYLPARPTIARTHLLHQTRTMSSSSIPSTMRGVLVEKIGGPEVLEFKTDLPVPQPGAGEVLIKNELAGLNYIDTYVHAISPSLQPDRNCTKGLPDRHDDSYFRTGLYPSKKPEILGKEGYGTIISLGPSTPEKPLHDLQIGDKVVWMGSSAYAEYTAAPALHTYKIPEGLKGELALAVFLQGLTALSLIREAHAVKKGEYVLVHAAAGGVGLLLCQMLREIGAKVIATSSTGEKLELAKKNGAEFLINYSEEKDLVGKVLKITGGKGVDVVFDGIGKTTFEDDLQLVKRKGSLISFGNASGAVPPFAIR